MFRSPVQPAGTGNLIRSRTINRYCQTKSVGGAVGCAMLSINRYATIDSDKPKYPILSSYAYSLKGALSSKSLAPPPDKLTNSEWASHDNADTSSSLGNGLNSVACVSTTPLLRNGGS